jgi:hypothetical protein
LRGGEASRATAADLLSTAGTTATAEVCATATTSPAMGLRERRRYRNRGRESGDEGDSCFLELHFVLLG